MLPWLRRLLAGGFRTPEPVTHPAGAGAVGGLHPSGLLPLDGPVSVEILARDGMEFVPRLWAAAAVAGGVVDLSHHQVDILYRGLRIQVILAPINARLQLGLYEREARPIPDDMAAELAEALLPGPRRELPPPPAPREPIPGLTQPGPWMRQYVGEGPNPMADAAGLTGGLT